MTLRIVDISVAAALAIAASLSGARASAQVTGIPTKPFILDTVHIETAEIYDTAGVLDILNNFHWRTQPSVIEDELFFDAGDTVTQADLDELERNLRELEIFSRITFTVTPRESDRAFRVPRATLGIRTKDSWSIRTAGAFSSTGDRLSLLGTLRETNLFGLGLQIGGSLEYSTVNDRGWRLAGFVFEPNLGGSHLNVGVNGAMSRFETSAGLFLERPYFSERSATAYAAGVSHYRGNEFFHLSDGENVRGHVSQTATTDAAGWYSIARSEKGSQFFVSGALSFDRTVRDSILPFAPRALENSVGAFVGIQSIKRGYERLEDADMSGHRLIPIGGSGAVSIGKVSPHNGGLDNVVYLGAEARQSVRHGPLHLFGVVAAGTGLAGKQSQFTIQRFTGTAHLKLPFGALATRLQQSTIWNWPRYVALALDNPSGLRGYDLTSHVGDNRIIANIEYRMFPLTQIWIFDVGAAAFYDVGSVWRQGETIGDARFHSSIGGGIRIGSANGTFNSGLLRVDVAYNFDEGRVSRLLISSHEAFDAFGTLDYRPPGPYLP